MTTDSVPAHNAEELLKPISFRVAERRKDLSGIRVESSAIDYWKAVHVVEQLLKDKAELSSLLATARADGAREAREQLAIADVTIQLACEYLSEKQKYSHAEK